jgi:serine/threonine protein kinase/uncharacterized C2H2 Zn-finger protein
MAGQCFNAIFEVAQMSFCEKTEFLHGIYDSYEDIDTISRKKLREISKQLDLKIDEIDRWLEKEKERRSQIASENPRKHPSRRQLPLSPNTTTTYGCNNTGNMDMAHYSLPLPNSLAPLDGMLSLTATSKHPTAPLKAKRGRPPNIRSSAHSDATPNTKRRKLGDSMDELSYLCPDCTVGTVSRCYTDSGWSDHVKRKHFPRQIWECQQLDSATRTTRCSRIFKRLEGFDKHLKQKHGYLGNDEIARLKVASKLTVVNHFHETCGFLDCTHEPFRNRNDSIEHIKSHFKKLAQQVTPPEDMGVSQWKDKCCRSHELTRGVHYHVNQANDGVEQNQDPEDDDDEEDDGAGNDDSSNQPPDNTGSHPDGESPPEDNDMFNDDDDFDPLYSKYTGGFGQYSAAQERNSPSGVDAQHSTYVTYGLEQFVLPFTCLRILGVGGHGMVHEVTDGRSPETFARKSVMRKGKNLAASSRLFHLKNELSILKELSHPYLVKMIGAYADSEYAHIIMSPVANQNLADRLSQSIRPDQLVRWMGPLASATSYLHARNIQHLDIKPQNILLKGDHILLADFGTAKYFTGFAIDLDDDLVVTPTYCAPETMLHHCQEYASDLFSLGCVFSEMLTRSFGMSIERFESFRAKHGNTAFYLTIPAVKEWITLLPRSCQSSGCQWSLRDRILQMLDEEPSARPKASDLQFDFSDISPCPVHGELWANIPSSAHGEVQAVGSMSHTSPSAMRPLCAAPTNAPQEVEHREICNSSPPISVPVLSLTSCLAQQYLDTGPSSIGGSEPPKSGNALVQFLPNANGAAKRFSARFAASSLAEMPEDNIRPYPPRKCTICNQNFGDTQNFIDHVDECLSKTGAEKEQAEDFSQSLQLAKRDRNLPRLVRQNNSVVQSFEGTEAVVLPPPEVISSERSEGDPFTASRILKSLEFHGMNQRYDEIPKAHEQTFEWIFKHNNTEGKPPWDSFPEWLKNGSGMFWVSGKAGSGKSTLMKFITDNRKTSADLRCWSKQSPITVASFFFWSAGTSIQRSMVGLLRSLLQTILQQYSPAIPALFLDRWKACKAHGGDYGSWSKTELIHALNVFVTDNTQRFCFFIDGLDESDEDPETLLNYIVSLSAKANVKICLTSRPWVVFEDALQGRPSLRLQDLTSRDITLYVRGHVDKNIEFAHIRRQQPSDAERLILEITERARGVFLWVFIVVRDLLNGLQNGDSIRDLQRRLHLLPSELEDLYDYGVMGNDFDSETGRLFLSDCDYNNWQRKPETVLPPLTNLDSTMSRGSHGDWGIHRAIITQMYSEEPKTLKEIVEFMEKEHKFKASLVYIPH